MELGLAGQRLARVLVDSEGDGLALTSSPESLAPHTSRIVALIGMEVDSIDDEANAISFTSGIDLIIEKPCRS